MICLDHMARTTIILDDEIQKKLKKKALKEGKTVTELIKNYVRAGLNRQELRAKPKKISLPSFSMGEPLIDPADRSRLWDILDEK